MRSIDTLSIRDFRQNGECTGDGTFPPARGCGPVVFYDDAAGLG